MRMKSMAAGVALCWAGAAWGQVFTIWAEAPETVLAGGTYTVEFWGSIEGGLWVQGESAMAGFGIDAIGSGAATMVTHAELADWAVGFGVEGTVDGVSVRGISGGQLANLFGGDLNPFIDLSNPIMLFSLGVTAGSQGSVSYTPANPNPNGGLAFYPDSQDGALIVAPNDPGTTLVLLGATTRIVPGPGGIAVLVIGCGLLSARARRRL